MSPAKRKAGLRTRWYRRGDGAAIAALFREVFGQGMDPAVSDEQHWRWEFVERTRRPRSIRLAFDGDRLVDQYAVLHRRFVCGDREIDAALSLDTMVHPDYRRANLFPRLAGELYDELARGGVALTYGFPNANSIHSFVKKLHWRELFSPPLLLLPLRPVRLARSREAWKRFALPGADALFSRAMRVAQWRPKARSGVEREPMPRFDARFDPLWQAARPTYRVAAARDAAYLRWRYERRPASPYELLRCGGAGGRALDGALVWRAAPYHGLTMAFVMDLIVDAGQPRRATALLRALIADASRRGLDAVAMLLPRHHPLRPRVLRAGLLPVPPAVFPQPLHVGVRVHDPSLADALERPDDWTVSWGDTDVL